MNRHLFKSVWNATIGNYVVVAESANNHSRSRSAAISSKPKATTQRLLRVNSFSLLTSLVALSPVLFSTMAQAACPSTPGGSVFVTGPGVTCTLADGSYAGNQAIEVENGATVNNSGTLNLRINSNSIGRGVRVVSNSQAFLHNVAVTGDSSGGQMYGLHASKGHIYLTGDYSFTGTGGNGVLGIVAGELPSDQGIVTIDGTTTINILAGNQAQGILVRSNAGSVVTMHGDLTINNAATGGWGIQAVGSSRVDLLGGVNTISMSGDGAKGITTANNAIINVTNALNLTGTGNGASGISATGGTINLDAASIITTGSALLASGGGKLNVSGDLVAQTSEINAYGAYATGANSVITLANADITTSGVGSYGVHAASNGTVNLNGSGTSRITINGNATSTKENYGLAAISGGYITTAAGTMLDVTTSGSASGTNRVYGLLATGTGSSITLGGTTQVTTTGFNNFGVRSIGNGTITVNGNLEISSSQGTGVQSSDAGSVVTLAGTRNDISVASQSGSISNGLLISNNATMNVNSAQTDIATTGSKAYGIQILVGGTLNLRGATSVATNGQASHGFYLSSGAQYTFDGTLNHIMPSFTINGIDSAVLAASGSNSLFTITGPAALSMSMTTGAGTWGAKAESLGRVRFSGSADTAGTGLWASNAILDLWGSANAAGSRVLLDSNANLNLESTGTSTIAIGSLEGAAGNTVNLYGHTLSIGSNNSSNNGSLLGEAEFAGTFTGTGSLFKTGTNTQILSGINTVANVTVDGGVLTLNQNGTFTTTGNYTTATGATTRLGTEETYLDVQGTFTQAIGSILDVTLNGNGNPDITARDAHLDGIISINGFNAASVPIKASEVTTSNYTLIRTTNGIVNDFDNNPIGSYGIDYLLHEGFVNGNDYELGFHLTWLADATEGHGDFTVNANTSFDVDIALNNQSNTYSSGWDGRSLMKDGEGLLVLSANNLYTGTTTLKAGELRTDINNAFGRSEQTIIQGGTLNLHATSQTVDNLSGTGGSVDIAGGTLSTHNTSDTVYQGAILDTAGTGQFIKTGAASLTLQGQTSWTGATLLEGGQLILDGTHGGAQLVSNIQAMNGTQLRLQNGATLTGTIDPTDLTIDSHSTWNMTGDSVVNHMNLAGTVNIAPPSANTFKTLTVEGNYTGQNGLIVFNGQLGEDTSPIDKLNIQGNTSGTTRVQVNNAGGTGAQTLNGIELITVQGQSDGEFVQSGRIVAGAYDYTLTRGESSDAGNWYLMSSLSPVDPKPVRRPEAGSYASNVAAAASLFNLRWQDHSQRHADIDPATGTYKLSGIWLHSQGAHTRHRDDSGQLHTRSNRSVVQLGADIIELNNDNGRTTFGIMGGYGSHRSTTRSQPTGHASTGRVEGYNLGVYGSWEQHPQENRGWYVDSWAHYSWLDNTVSGYALPTETYNADGLTASLEAGYTFKVGENETSKASYYVQPQAQLIWMGSKSGDHREINGTLVRMQGQNTVQSRVGMKAFMQTRHGATPFVEGNWIHNNAQAGANLDGVSVYQAGGHNMGEVRIGVEGQISRNVSASGKLEHRMGERNYRDTALSVEVKVSF